MSDPYPGPPIPQIDESNADRASLEYSKHRTKLSTHRTGLSEHRTDLSTKRTDMSKRRTEMSSRRTGMSFQRTRMSADRTLMGIIRTSLSMISFGFTIYQGFRGLVESHVLGPDAGEAGSFFGQVLVYLGVALIAAGILYHISFMTSLRSERKAMTKGGLIHGESGFPISVTFVVALCLLLLGVAAIVGIVFHLGPFD